MKDSDTQTHDTTYNSAEARWSRFRDALKPTLSQPTWDILQATWDATAKPSDEPVTEADYMTQPPGSLARICNADGTVIFAYRTAEEWRWCEADGGIRNSKAKPWGVPGRTCRIVARDVPQTSPTQIAAELRPISAPVKVEPTSTDVLPRVVEWEDLQPGDLALDVNERGPAIFGHRVERTVFAWRRANGRVDTYSSPGCARAPRAVLFACDVSDDADAVRLAFANRNVTPELEAEARRPAP